MSLFCGIKRLPILNQTAEQQVGGLCSKETVRLEERQRNVRNPIRQKEQKLLYGVIRAV